MIDHAVAVGLFPSRQAVLEAGVERLMQDEPFSIPQERLNEIERALDDLDAGLGIEWNVVEEMRRYHARRQAKNP